MVKNLIDRLRDLEVLTSLDRHFALLIQRLAGQDSAPLGLAAGLVSRYTGQGHVCLDLAALAGRPVPDVYGAPTAVLCPELPDWLTALEASGVAGRGETVTPLLLESSRLYLQKYWTCEQQLAADLHRLAQAPPAPMDHALLQAGLDRLFPDRIPADWQKIAAAVAVLQNLCIISGGPGTGKTSTVVKILALLLEQASGDLRIGLAAPTGKAAGRLQEAIRAAKGRLQVELRIGDRIPEQALTLHRLLGKTAGRPGFRYHGRNPLPLDVLVVDEASMADLALLAGATAALPEHGRLLLLGDKDQLASVEAGAVLADICGGKSTNRFSGAAGARLAALGLGGWQEPSLRERAVPLLDCLVLLEKNYRFGPDSGIGRLARAVNRGEVETAVATLAGPSREDLTWHSWQDASALEELARLIRRGYAPYLQAASPAEAFAAYNRFRVLCAHREGPQGVAAMNRWAEDLLSETGLRPGPGPWYAGRPVMITANDYGLGLYNGDVGVTMAEGREKLRVYFPRPEGGLRAVAPVRLPAHETAFAMTVHKSQGSEFAQVALLLPERPSPVLCRELLYTAVTRARDRLAVWANRESIEAAVKSRLNRATGLQQKLWGHDG